MNMNALEKRREKEREKKRKQREKLKTNQEQYVAAKKRDSERKRKTRQIFKENVTSHPRKFKRTVEKIKEETAARVRKHRAKKNENNNVETNRSAKQSKRWERERARLRQQKKREVDQAYKIKNALRVNNYRLRIKLNSPKTPPNMDILETDQSASGYKHRSSETRAFKRLKRVLPCTPAKKVKLIEKLLTNSTPRSRVMLQKSETLQATISTKISRKRLCTQFALIESMKNKVSVNKKSSTIAAAKLLKNARKMSSAAAMLNVSAKTLSRSLTEKGKRKERNDKLSEEEVNKVQNFYLEEASREMPNKRDVILLKNEEGKKFPTAKHMMEMPQSEAYEKFKTNNPNIKVGQRKFDMLRPQQVRHVNVAHRVVCCCTYCENIRLKLQTLNKVTLKPLKSTNELLNATLCPKTEQFHAKACIQRECTKCGTQLLDEMFSDDLKTIGNREITYSTWAKKNVVLDETRNVSRVMLVQEQSTFGEFFHALKNSLATHAAHIFRASWQYCQFRRNVDNIKEGEVVMCMDFAENYTCRYGREIQSAHWNQKQITIHPMMLYYLKDGQLQKEGYSVITDDLKHDAHAVDTFEKSAIDHLRKEGVSVNKVHQWTDGCAAQYKCKNSFASISLAETSLDISMTRNYFETSHGKGPCDGLGGIIKRKVTNSIVQNSNLQVSTAKDLVLFCENNLKIVGGTLTSRANQYAASKRTFQLVESIDRTRQTTCKTLNGSRKLHSVRSTGIGHQIETRLLSCYCDGCRNNGDCDNAEYTEPWNKQVLKSCDAANNLPDSDAQNIETDKLNEDESTQEIGANDFVAVKFNAKSGNVCYFAKVIQCDDNDIHVEFLQKRGRMYQYSDPADESWEKQLDIVCRLNEPNVVLTGSRSKCEFNLSDSQKDLLKGYRLM